MNILERKVYEDFKNLMPADNSGWGGDHPIFESMVRQKRPKVIVELGTWKGQSALNMAAALKNNNIDGKVYCIDTWLGGVEHLLNPGFQTELDLILRDGCRGAYYQFLSNVIHANMQNYMVPIVNTTSIGLKYLYYSHVKADLIYVDASHEYEDVLSDINLSLQILNENGTLFGHDFDPKNWPGVCKAVTDAANSHGLQIAFRDYFWIYIKK